MTFPENCINGVVYMTSPNIGTTHAFTTRIGGVSNGIFESLNLTQSNGDEIENVKKNYTILCNALGISTDDIVRTNQIHGTHIRVVTQNDRGELFTQNSYQADGLITKTSGVVLMVFVADCVPVLLYDPVNNAAGAVHAGWRGTVADIAGAAIGKLVSEFDCSPANIKAAIGPCISKCCFVTDTDVADGIYRALGNDAEKCLEKRGTKYFIDLKEANHLLLQRAGVKDITISDECTSCCADKYWSHRKTQGHRGSQAALIILKEPQ